MVQTGARAARKAAEAEAAAAAARAEAAAEAARMEAAAKAFSRHSQGSAPSLQSEIKKKKRPGKQARDRIKAGLAVRAAKKLTPLERPAEVQPTSTTGSMDKVPWPRKLKEKWFVCADCSTNFSWPVDEQELFKDQGFEYKPPTRCATCRKAKKAHYDGATHCFKYALSGFTNTSQHVGWRQYVYILALHSPPTLACAAAARMATNPATAPSPRSRSRATCAAKRAMCLATAPQRAQKGSFASTAARRATFQARALSRPSRPPAAIAAAHTLRGIARQPSLGRPHNRAASSHATASAAAMAAYSRTSKNELNGA